MFAVLKTGGQQYKVAKDDIFLVEKLVAEAGETVQFNEVLMLGRPGILVCIEVNTVTPITEGNPFQLRRDPATTCRRPS